MPPVAFSNRSVEPGLLVPSVLVAAKSLSGSATAVLVFPKITKAGLGIGGQYGDGVLLKGGKVTGFYNTSGASYGLQAGAQQTVAIGSGCLCLNL